jgi:hypothetical protein
MEAPLCKARGASKDIDCGVAISVMDGKAGKTVWSIIGSLKANGIQQVFGASGGASNQNGRFQANRSM